MKQRIFNLIILDESGSMQSIKPQAVSGVNETLQTIKGAQQQFEEQEHLVTFVTFNFVQWGGSDRNVRIHYKYTPVELVREITADDYTPNGGTPLYDAMGMSLTQLRSMVKDEDKVLVTIITDGYENASREYDGKTIARLVGELRERGWTFTYIGANQDVDKVAEEMGIKHRLAFSADIQGTKAMFEKERMSRAHYYQKVSERALDADEDFFGNSDGKNTEDKKDKKENENEITDPLLRTAAEIIVSQQSGSTSLLQIKLPIGYNRAYRLMDQLGQLGIVGPSKGAHPRDVYCSNLKELDQKLGKKEETLDKGLSNTKKGLFERIFRKRK